MTVASENKAWRLPAPVDDQTDVDWQAAAEELQHAFSIDFSIWDGGDAELLNLGVAIGPLQDLTNGEVVRAAARNREVQFVADADGVVVLAIPITLRSGSSIVATGVFATDEAERNIERVANLLGQDTAGAEAWLSQQQIWNAEILLRLGEAVAGKLNAEAEAGRLRDEVDSICQNLSSTYEEISLLYTVTNNLRISRSQEELAQLAIDWLVGCVPAKSFAVHFPQSAGSHDSTGNDLVLIDSGDCPVDVDEFQCLVEELQLNPDDGPFVANTRRTAEPSWNFPSIRQLIVVPITEGEHLFGWLAAFNHQDDDELGAVEANLLISIGTLLGIHSGNRNLYRQQTDLFASVVRALVSAIDAKDPYTSGHSDRVARYAARIGLEMRLGPKLLNTMYMAGLLHDIGKIGIDDNVLRKPGRLTDAEFNHIKMHPELGYKILVDIKQLADVLPAVLHHHERWDGRGYPKGLQFDEIPQIARVMAVADAYDAMTSDRPYRSGMPEERVDEIFREGAGVQWDPQVTEAFFQAKSDIIEIRQSERGDPHDIQRPMGLAR